MEGDRYYRVSVSASGASYDLSEDLSSFTIDQREGQADLLTIDMKDPFKILGHALQEGMDIEVELGTASDHAVVFRGRIYRVHEIFPENATPTFQLQACDRRMKMGLRQRNRVWADMTLSDIVKAIASDYFTDVNVSLLGDPRFENRGIRQQEETDLAFLLRLAATYGCVMYVTAGDRDDTFHFIAQYAVMKATPAVQVHYGRTDVKNRLLSFQSSVDASMIELPRVLSGIDYDLGQATELATTELLEAGTAGDPFFDENLTAYRASQPLRAAQLEALLSSASVTQSTLRADLGAAVREAAPAFSSEEQQSEIAQNQFSTSLRGMRATGTTTGIRDLVAQTNIDVADVGGRFSGTWFLSQVRHILDQQGYRSEFECRR
jgi:uncharacterized protein